VRACPCQSVGIRICIGTLTKIEVTPKLSIFFESFLSITIINNFKCGNNKFNSYS